MYVSTSTTLPIWEMIAFIDGVTMATAELHTYVTLIRGPWPVWHPLLTATK